MYKGTEVSSQVRRRRIAALLDNDDLIPSNQILLLSGPPGLGKTTLAHIVAKHAGYNVFEINARCVNQIICIRSD